MKKTMIRLISLLLCAALLLGAAAFGAAADGPFSQAAYTNVVTFSDCQNIGPVAYNNFGNVLRVMKDDGLPEPDALVVGGDYSLIMHDIALPGVLQLREQYQTVYPGSDPDDIICAQGNHDLRIAAFHPTGMYDMGTFCLYVINEDQYPWKQSSNADAQEIVKATAQDIEAALHAMQAANDLRPVLLVTHVPLHFTNRNGYGDNLYASYIFDVLNKAAETMDIIFLFGHNHSGDYDDAIGGSVNFMAPGDTVCVPTPENPGPEGYRTETLNFTYTNCGYIGYSNNHVSDTSTNVLTLGAIRFFEDHFVFLKYTKDGLFRSDSVARVHRATPAELQASADHAPLPRNNERLWALEVRLLAPLFRVFVRLFRFFTVGI